MIATRQRPARVCLAKTDLVKSFVASLLTNGCTIEAGVKEGHLTMKDGDTVVYKALQKGKGGPWMVSMYNSDRIKWPK